MNERQSAYKVLLKIEKSNSYSNLALDAELSGLEVKEGKPLIAAIVYGTVERQITLDFVLSQYLTQPIKKLKPEVLIALRMGAYQILYMDKIPPFAAVNESVKIVKNSSNAYASGLVNSVLRKIATNGITYPQTKDEAFDLSVKYSCPKPLVEHFIKNYGLENTKGILMTSIGAAPIIARVNTIKISTNDLIKELAKEYVEAEVFPQVENAIILKKSGAIEDLEAYQKGYFHIQDISSQKCCEALGPQKGDTVIDLCSAPGGKSFTIAEIMQNEGKLLSFDLYSSRAALVAEGAIRLGIKIIKAAKGDALKHNPILPLADRVLCDVPCSGLGIIRRKPEIKYKELSLFDNLPEMQYNILQNASQYVKKNGVLVYSTCTLNPKENEEVCNRFLSENKNFHADSISKDMKYLTLLPHINNSDGFFIARFICE